MEGIETAKLCARYADDKKAEDIVILDVRGLSPVSDYFVICTATSNPQLRAVRDEIISQMRDQHDQRPLFHEGVFESQWIVVDYTDVMVHIFTPEKRGFYAIEELWGDAPRVPWPEAAAESQPQPVPKNGATKERAVKKAATKRTTVKKTARKRAR